ncbi:BamA/OMP85 family outer membrane protein [Saccharicrinis fermentans]|uniref:Outer membrane protein Omp85 n=1 Tax=Saccharicrinis fermentans DSM 9555 = JCM 21142 TaxID=869213 RepID=W7Y2V4_9BACT|nr:POTRA domain-containing protein [Saccharicrinis fermentans]GAF05160.1 outer membrane protein Omp85 precursor [Saccharicrinis fermentans DSM 9555 = JCM 21142]
MLKHFTLFFIILTILPTLSFAQNQDNVPVISYSATPRKYEIAEINVTGIQNYDPKILVNLSGLRVGQKLNVPGEEISEAIRKYWEHGLFSDVKIVATKIESGKIWLEIQLLERPRLSDINYYGLKKSEVETVSEKVAMMKGSQVTPYLITRSEKYITDYFVAKGFYNTEVRVVQKDDTTQVNHVYLDITVDKKEKVKVRSLEFLGNTVFSDSKLNRTMKKTNAKGKIKNFFRTKKFINETYQEDLVAVIDKYNEFGYRDMIIDYDSIAKNDDNTVDIKIKVEEGAKYYLGDISWIGNSIYPGEYLSAMLRLKKGDVFNQKLLDERLFQDDDAVHNLYMNNGYLFSNIQPVEVNVYGDTIDLEMRVYEGKQATINNIVINGNTKTHEHVVRREVRTKPGQLFSKSELIRTIRELSQLGHFNPENIQPDVQPNPEDGTVDLVYNLEEKANDQIELSGGWGAGMFVGSLGLKFSNFSVRNIFNKESWRPLPTGDGQTLSLRAQTNGKYYQSYSFSFTEPWLGGKRPNSLTVSAYRSIQSSVSDSYYSNYNSYFSSGSYGGYGNTYGYSQYDASDFDQHMKIFGISVGFGKRLTWPDDWFSLYAEVSYQHYDLLDWQYFIMQNGVSQNLHFKFIFSRNSIDNPLYTRRGSNFSFGVEFTPPYSAWIDKNYKSLYNTTISGDTDERADAQEELYDYIEYHKWTTQGSIFTPLDKSEKLVLMGKYEMGFLGYYNEYVRSPYEKFMLGGDGMSGYSMYGSQTVGLRGYENSSLTPRNRYGSYDGNIYNKLTFEMRYPLTLQPSAQVYALGFLEAGNAWSDFQDYNPFDLKRSAGVGVRIFLPIFGLMGIDWGYGFDEAQVQGSNGSQFHFVIGQQF